MLKQEFMNYCSFPGVIGAIDCTHVAIIAPGENGVHVKSDFVNRKNYHSMNVQIVCDMEQRILNLSARFPGSVHDAYIWRMSPLKAYLMASHSSNKNAWLLGDSGYPLEPWLLTPYPDFADGSPEARYNVAHSRGRSVIERCNGTLKSRFRCLLRHRTLNYSPTAVENIINACAILHNMCIDAKMELTMAEMDPDDQPFDTGVPIINNSRQSQIVRDRVAASF